MMDVKNIEEKNFEIDVFIMKTGSVISFIAIFSFSFAQVIRANDYAEFGVIRANIANYCKNHRWLVCCEPKRFPDTSEVVGFDSAGRIFRVRGDLRPGVTDMLSLDSYENPSVTLSTTEGYIYIWNSGEGANPFEFPLNIEDYKKLIRKFELYPLLGSSKDGPISFELLKDNPDYYDRILLLPRPRSMFHLENPSAKRVNIGIFPSGRPNAQGFFVKRILENSAAAAADLKPDDYITKFVINGKNYDLENGFPLPNEESIRIISLRIARKSKNNEVSFFDTHVFPPSAVERFLLR